MRSNVSGNAAQLAEAAYVYGYPLVTMEMTRRLMTNVATPEGLRAPMGQFVHARAYPGADFRDVTTPNADTLYSAAWIDVSDEPYIFTIPDVHDRYCLFPMLDAWTTVFQSPGKRTTGTRAQGYAITAPGWAGRLPEGIKEVKSPTGMVWIIGRSYCTGTPDDCAKVHRLQDQLELVPLSKHGQRYQPPPGPVDPSLDMNAATRDQVHGLSGLEYFKLLAELMKRNPPAEADAPMLSTLSELGIVPGASLDVSKLDPTVRNAIDRAPTAAQGKILEQVEHIGKLVNGWLVPLRMGVYGTDYAHRAGVSIIAIGANLPEDAVYPISKAAANGQPYSGAKDYVLHFAADELPPVRAFWSLTMYDEHMFFAGNPLNKYTVSPRDDLRFNADGSLDISIQHESPGVERLANWLPAPTGRFNLVLRLYWPEASVVSGPWAPPPVVERLSP